MATNLRHDARIPQGSEQSADASPGMPTGMGLSAGQVAALIGMGAVLGLVLARHGLREVLP